MQSKSLSKFALAVVMLSALLGMVAGISAAAHARVTDAPTRPEVQQEVTTRQQTPPTQPTAALPGDRERGVPFATLALAAGLMVLLAVKVLNRSPE